MTTVHIPDSMADAIKSLTGMNALLTAKEWERAAIVYAFTYDTGGGRPKSDGKPTLLRTVEGFAAIGVAGLKTRETVATYRRAWQSAIDDGQAQPVGPGDDIELPTIPWPPTAHVRGRIDMARASAPPEEKAQIVRQLITEDPKVSEIVARDPVIARSVSEARSRTEEPREVETYSPPIHNHRADLVRAVGLFMSVVRAIQSGDYTPTTSEQFLLHALGLLISQMEPEAEPDANLFTEIDQYLREGSAL